MSSSPSANPLSYPGTTTYLQLVSERITNNTAYLKLYLCLTQLHTYITTISRDALQTETLRDRFVPVMEQANSMQTVIKEDSAVKEADQQCRAEILTLLGQLHLRDNERRRAEEEAEGANTKRWIGRVAGGALLAAGAVVVGPALLVGGLNLVGFSAIGPVAGSIAAGIQSAVYGGAVGAGSLFALCQSAAMGGIVVGSAAEIAAGVAALGAGAGLLGGLGGSGDDDGTNGDNNAAGPAPNGAPAP
ncbi:hypothetical protein FRB90_004997 [Tulasnella sp. 427]|nr:hypothetical protein FRB90_004997 [Tulasnella sp. 427]